MDEAFYRRLRNAEGLCKIRVGNVFAFRGQATAEHIENAAPSALFTLLAEPTQSALNHRRRPSHIEHFFGRPRFRFSRRNRELRWQLCHPLVPRDKLDIAPAFARAALVSRVV